MLTPAEIKLAEAVSRSGNITEACAENNISRVAFYKKLKTHPEFAAFVKELEQANKDEALRTIVAASHRVAETLVNIAEGKIRSSTPRLNACIFTLKASGINPDKPTVEELPVPVSLSAAEIKERLLARRKAAGESLTTEAVKLTLLEKVES
jgi:hypothetical protein